MEDEINLAQEFGNFLELLLRQWRLILSVCLISSLIVGLISILLPKRYKASVLVATTKVTSLVSFGSNIQTISEEQLLASGSGAYRLVDPALRLQTYGRLIENPIIAQAVLDDLGSKLKENERQVAQILDWVDGGIAPQSDALRISVTYSDPVVVADLANAWGREYVKQINAIYSATGSQEAYTAVAEQAAQAQATYEQAQADLEAFIAQNRSSEYTRQIEALQHSMTTLQESRAALVTDMLTQRSQATLKSYNESLNDIQVRLQQAYADRRRLDSLLDDVEDMRAQVQAGGDPAAASNALALTILKAQVFAASGGLGETLQIQTQPVTTTAEAMAGDLDAMAATLQDRRETLQSRVDDLTQQLLNVDPVAAGFDLGAVNVVQSVNEMIDIADALKLDVGESSVEAARNELEEQIRALQSKLAEENARLTELTQKRDLAWETFKSLTTKEAELSVAVQASGSEVALAAPAAVPDRDTVSGTRNVMVAAVVGVLVGVFSAFFIEFWWGYKGIQPYPITLKSLLRRT